MKKILAILLAVACMFSMLLMTACGDDTDDGEGTGTNAGTEAGSESEKETETETETEKETETETETESAGEDVGEPERNYFPYEGDVVPGSVDWDWGAPTADAVYFSIDADHVIHDGKGTWSNTSGCTPDYVFDCSPDTYYDCDEKCETVNNEDMNVGIAGDWDGITDGTATGYVGAWIEEGVVIEQIRFFTRSGWVSRILGCKFQASVDGENWVDLHTVTELAHEGGDYEMIDIEDDTVYYYVRFLSRDLESFNTVVDADSTDYYAYCNIAEMEIWGTPAN